MTNYLRERYGLEGAAQLGSGDDDDDGDGGEEKDSKATPSY